MHLHKRQQFRLRRATAHRCFHRAQWASFPHRPQHSSWWFHKWETPNWPKVIPNWCGDYMILYMVKPMVWITSMSGNTQLQKIAKVNLDAVSIEQIPTKQMQVLRAHNIPRFKMDSRTGYHIWQILFQTQFSLGSQSWDSTDLENE